MIGKIQFTTNSAYQYNSIGITSNVKTKNVSFQGRPDSVVKIGEEVMGSIEKIMPKLMDTPNRKIVKKFADGTYFEVSSHRFGEVEIDIRNAKKGIFERFGFSPQETNRPANLERGEIFAYIKDSRIKEEYKEAFRYGTDDREIKKVVTEPVLDKLTKLCKKYLPEFLQDTERAF